MGKTGFAVTAILATVAIARAGGDPWKTKPFDQWPQQDVQEVLQNSPGPSQTSRRKARGVPMA